MSEEDEDVDISSEEDEFEERKDGSDKEEDDALQGHQIKNELKSSTKNSEETSGADSEEIIIQSKPAPQLRDDQRNE